MIFTSRHARGASATAHHSYHSKAIANLAPPVQHNLPRTSVSLFSGVRQKYDVLAPSSHTQPQFITWFLMVVSWV